MASESYIIMLATYFFLHHDNINLKYFYIYVSEVFMVSREVEKSLMDRETSKCLAWCHDNRSKLRKLHSTMEFNLRVQEFVELVKADRRLDAVR